MQEHIRNILASIKNPRFATDLGDVVVKNYSEPRVLIEDSLRVLQRLVGEIFGEKHSFVISRVNGVASVERSRARLKSLRFCEETGIPEENLRYCFQRQEKAPIAQELDISIMIDDRPEVLAYMDNIVPIRILFAGDKNEFTRFEPKLKHVIQVQNWKDIEALFFPTVL